MRNSLFVLLLSAAASVQAADAPKVGAYAFDWLKPETTRCRALSAADVKRIAPHCQVGDGHAFGLDDPTHRCQLNELSELFVYATSAQCEREFETMQANGP